jgi:aromatic ring-opening dioxygenase catalytic subunit (LigB family)
MAVPVLFLPHGGGPLPLLADPAHAGLTRFMADIPARLGKPKAILVVSAHWEESQASVTSAALPELIYDYYGFPPESYQIRYPAPGAPELAARIGELLAAQNIAVHANPSRGFDHGLFVPLKLMYPTADIPCIQLSLLSSLDPAEHIRLGEALAPLSDEGVLIIGSGLSFHNLRAFFSEPTEKSVADSLAFDDWLRHTMTAGELDNKRRAERLRQWQQAPAARFCHPREEHLLPLHVCFGVAKARGVSAQVVFNDRLMGMWTSGFLWQ